LTAVLGPASFVRRGGALLLVVSLAATAGCVGDRPTLADDAETTTTTVLDATTTTAPAGPTKVAQAKADSIEVFGSATDPAPDDEITADEATAAPDIPIVFLVQREQGDRIEVFLPTPPNGSTAWVRATDVTVSRVTFRVEVSLRAHRIRVYDGPTTVLDESASIGQTDRPDPGSYYIKELLQPPDANGPYGAYAYGLSGFSTDLSSFSDGNGIIGIHGTNDPDSIGADSPAGCIGRENSVISRLVDEIGLPLGTPVEVTA
jgi:lipoprotein-anchoring transpeptidase ErfK/SrfK